MSKKTQSLNSTPSTNTLNRKIKILKGLFNNQTKNCDWTGSLQTIQLLIDSHGDDHPNMDLTNLYNMSSVQYNLKKYTDCIITIDRIERIKNSSGDNTATNSSNTIPCFEITDEKYISCLERKARALDAVGSVDEASNYIKHVIWCHRKNIILEKCYKCPEFVELLLRVKGIKDKNPDAKNSQIIKEIIALPVMKNVGDNPEIMEMLQTIMSTESHLPST